MTDDAGKKFTVFMFAAGMLLGLIFTSVSFTAWQRCNGRESLFCFTAAQAKLIASNVKCSLSFSDMEDANSILDSLKTQNFIAFAGIYDCNNRLFAYYYRDDLKQNRFQLIPPSKTKYRYHNGYLIVYEPVIVDHNLVGTVCLWAQP